MMTVIFMIACATMFVACLHQANQIVGHVAPKRHVFGLIAMMVGDVAMALAGMYRSTNCAAVTWLGDFEMAVGSLIMLGISSWLFSERRVPYFRP